MGYSRQWQQRELVSNQHGDREPTFFENLQFTMQYLSSLHKGIANGFISLGYLQQRVSQQSTEWIRIQFHTMFLNISILNNFILHTQKIIHKPLGSVWKQVKWKIILERNSIQSSSLHKHKNTITWFSLILMGGGRSYPSWYISQRPYRIIIYMAEHLNHFLIILTKKDLLSNISTKTQNFQPKASSTA